MQCSGEDQKILSKVENEIDMREKKWRQEEEKLRKQMRKRFVPPAQQEKIIKEWKEERRNNPDLKELKIKIPKMKQFKLGKK